MIEAVGAAVLVVAGLAGLAIAARRGRLAVRRRWYEAARKLGMTVGRRAVPGGGERDHVMFRDRVVPVFAYRSMVNAKDDTPAATSIVASIDPPLKMRLSVAPSGIFHGDGVKTGNTSFDGVYHVTGIDSAQTRYVVARIADELKRRELGAWSARIDDATVALHRGDEVSESAVLGPAIEVVERITTKLHEARASAPLAAWERDALQAMDAVGSMVGAKVDRRRHRVAAKLATVDVTVATELGPSEITTRVESRFERPLEVALRIGPQSAGGAVLSWLGASDDIRLGDDAFDRAFLVRGRPVDLVKELLDQALRDRLCAMLARAKDVAIDETGVRLVLEGAPAEPAVLRTAVDDVVEVTRRLSKWGRASRGAYR